MVPSMAAFFFLLTFLPSFISATPITLPLQQHFLLPTPLSNPYHNLNSLVNSSQTRAHRIKHPTNPSSSTTATSSASDFTAKTELTPHSYGGYSTSLSFGTPPQTLSFVVDTASSFVWFPCTTHYLCQHCAFPSPTSRIPSFIPVLSSSSKIVGCRNPKCSWIHGRRRRPQQCGNCGYGGRRRSRYCSQICPPYLILYGSGTTGGVALSETLRFRNLTVPNFLIGCSVFSSRQPAGIAGLGRGRSSLASQLGLAKFSYCLLSHRFDDDSVRSGYLVLDSGSGSGTGTKTRGMIYTPFVKNPFVLNKPDYSVYYYLGLRRISVGGRRVGIPYRYLSPGGSDGSGGTIVDSGTTFTFMSRGVFEPVSRELAAQMENNGSYSRARAAEAATGLRPCFRAHGTAKAFPELRFHFKGGADMVLPVENYFTYVGTGGASVACLAVVTDVEEEERSGGPSVILGNFQMQNFRVEYDLDNQRFGFKQQPCSH